MGYASSTGAEITDSVRAADAVGSVGLGGPSRARRRSSTLLFCAPAGADCAVSSGLSWSTAVALRRWAHPGPAGPSSCHRGRPARHPVRGRHRHRRPRWPGRRLPGTTGLVVGVVAGQDDIADDLDRGRARSSARGHVTGVAEGALAEGQERCRLHREHEGEATGLTVGSGAAFSGPWPRSARRQGSGVKCTAPLQ